MPSMGGCRPKSAVDGGSHAATLPCIRNDGLVDIAGTEVEAGGPFGKVFRRARSLEATCPRAVGALDQGGAS